MSPWVEIPEVNRGNYLELSPQCLFKVLAFGAEYKPVNSFLVCIVLHSSVGQIIVILERAGSTVNLGVFRLVLKVVTTKGDDDLSREECQNSHFNCQFSGL
jgi:hypothetical protein